MVVGMDPHERRVWRHLEDLAARPVAVHRWNDTWNPSGLGSYHACPTLVACLTGVVRVEGDRRRVDLRPGEVLLIAPGVCHRHAPLRQGSLAFGQGLMAVWSDVLLAQRGWQWQGRLPREPSRRYLEEAVLAQEADLPDLMTRLLAEVLSETVAELRFGHPGLRAMLDRLWKQVHHGITADDLVAASGLSRSQAWAIFTAAYGTTPRRAIAQMRLSLAQGLVAAGHPLVEVATAVGYTNADALRRAWKEQFGVPPRRRH